MYSVLGNLDRLAVLGEMSKGLENRPYMVVDDGWETDFCTGPWAANGKFKDMKKLAKNIKNEDVYKRQRYVWSLRL